jgi:hypothetical protein
VTSCPVHADLEFSIHRALKVEVVASGTGCLSYHAAKRFLFALSDRPLEFIVNEAKEHEVTVPPILQASSFSRQETLKQPTLRDDRACTLQQRIQGSVLVAYRNPATVEADEVSTLCSFVHSFLEFPEGREFL